MALNALYATKPHGFNQSIIITNFASNRQRDSIAIHGLPMPVKLVIVRNFLPFFLLFSCSGAALGQPAALTPTQAQALVARALATESHAAQELTALNHPMRYRLRKSSPRLTSTKEIAETRDGDVARLVALNDQPLNQADELREEARLDALLSDPGLQRHRKQSEDNDTARAMKVLRVLPTAFLYQFTGTGKVATGTVEKFTFKPNPQFDPPDMETGILTAMVGEIWVDPVQERVVHLEGHLQQDKEIALGIVQMDKGGWVEIDQADVGGHQWRIVRIRLKMDMRILFKGKSSDSVQEFTQFQPLPANLSYRQAIQMLRGNPKQ
jgi:hypothetical protein